MPDAEVAVTPTTQTDLRTSEVAPEYGVNGSAQEDHFQAAMQAAIKEAEAAHAKDAPAPEKIQEAEDLEALKAKEAEAKPEPEAKKDEEEKPASPGTLGKARRLFAEGKIEEALELALGVNLAKIEPTTKQWKGVKRYVLEAKEEVTQVRQQAEQEVNQARHVAQQLQPFINGAQAYLKGDFATFLKLTTGDTPENFQRKLIGQLHEAPKSDPALLARLEAVERERQAERAQTADANRKYQELQAQQKYEQAVTAWKSNIAAELKDTEYAKAASKPVFLDRVYDMQAKHYNARTQTTLDTSEAAELVWEEMYGGVVETPQLAGSKAGTTQSPRVNGDNTERTGAGNAGNTTLRLTQPTEAGAAGSVPWSPENQEKLMEQYIRQSRSLLAAQA